VAYSAPLLTATGATAPYTWSIVGALPAGLSLNASTGAITGSPQGAGTANFTVQVADSSGQMATRALHFHERSISGALGVRAIQPGFYPPRVAADWRHRHGATCQERSSRILQIQDVSNRHRAYGPPVLEPAEALSVILIQHKMVLLNDAKRLTCGGEFVRMHW
jgi:hypothetical protein